VLYDPAEHCSLAMPLGQDLGVANLAYRSLALWLLGYPEAAQADNETSIKDARVIGHAATLILALTYTSIVDVLRCANYATAKPTNDELVALADEKGAVFWKTGGTLLRGHLIALAGEAEEGVQIITSSMAALRATGAKMFVPFMLAHLSTAYIEIGHFDNAWRSISEAMTHIKTTKERWLEAEVNRVAGQVALCSPEHDAAKAQSHFERALAVARQQQAKSWELRAAMSLARLWRDQGKVSEARELLAPVYGWFTEGFDTLDLKEAKKLLEELTA
jgi:predicted ATPase